MKERDKFHISKEEMAIIVGENVDRLCSIEIRPRMAASGVFPHYMMQQEKNIPILLLTLQLMVLWRIQKKKIMFLY